MPGLPCAVMPIKVAQYDDFSGWATGPFVFIRFPFVCKSVDAPVVVVVIIYIEEKESTCVCRDFDSCDVVRLKFYLLYLCGLNISIY